jgi:hypothetical protein
MGRNWLSLIFLSVVVGCHSNARVGDGGGGGFELGLVYDDLATSDDLSGEDLSVPPGDDGGCGLVTCSSAGAACGDIGDGCGGLINCGSCGTNQTCVMGQCITNMGMCTPKSCMDQGFNCGLAGDTCGNVINCGTPCPAPQICGGGGVDNVCGNTCTKLCLQQVACDMGSTTISGTVLAPTNAALGYGNPDPLPNALVYVPNGTVMPFTAGVSCDACGAQVTGIPLVSVASGVDGTFTLPNAPCGTNIPLVIQLGRWRRHIVIPSVACCANTALTADQTRFPRTQGEGGDPLNNIPLIAVQTGAVDPIECILPKIGIDASQYSNPGGTGRVQLFQGTGCYLMGNKIKTGASGATINATTPLAANALWNSPTTLGNYDAVIADCVDCEIDAFSNSIVTTTTKKNVLDYVNAGGRLFASHYSYVWLYQNAPLSSTANWNINQCWPPSLPNACSPPNTLGYTTDVNTSFPEGQLFGNWLNGVGAATANQFTAYQVRHDFTAVNAPSQLFLSVDSGSAAGAWAGVPIEYTFNTPVGGANQCGRVLFSDFHVNTSGVCNQTCTFPTECGAAKPMTPQEKVLEYMLFNLTSCVPPTVNGCTPTTCMALGYNCGKTGDGCGNIIDCGMCPSGQTCGANNMPNVCGSSPTPCTPATCQSLGFNCGKAGDGCGGVLDCGTCPTGQTCGGGGSPNVCGAVG